MRSAVGMLVLIGLSSLFDDVSCRAAGRQSHTKDLLYKASTHGTIGEANSLHLANDGFLFTPLSNDALGDTDKLMTGSTKLTLLKSRGAQSLMFSLFWRALTPVYRKHLAQKDLSQPFGSFADWAEVQAGYAGSLPLKPSWARFCYQLLLGLGHIGNKGLKGIHSRIHRLANLPQGGLGYTEQPVGLTGTFGVETAAVLRRSVHVLSNWDIKLVSGAYRNLAMFDLYSGFNATTPVTKDLRLGVEARLARQLGSALYENPRLWRYELSAGMRSYLGLLTTIKYVSPYLQQDDVRQIYLEVSFIKDSH